MVKSTAPKSCRKTWRPQASWLLSKCLRPSVRWVFRRPEIVGRCRFWWVDLTGKMWSYPLVLSSAAGFTDLPSFLSSKMWCRRKSSVSANFCHCTAFLPHSNTQIHSAATRARASARQQISILAKHACATVVRANDITPPTPPQTTSPRPTQQQKCAKGVNV